EKWLTEAVDAAAAGNLTIDAVLLRENWRGGGKDSILPCGLFSMDSVDASGPPATISIKATSLPFSATARQTEKTKAWEAYNLSGIATEMAGNAGMTCMYESASNPYYERVEQYKVSDIAFLSTLCHAAGISLKVTNKIIVLFDQADYEAKSPVFYITKGDGSYMKYKLHMGSADAQYGSCRVSYVYPETGQCISGAATASDEDAKSSQRLELTA
ncbi:MAG: hypothetical protein Q4B48_08875, partial [Syntrophomonadaceae bacterium]|nr:hypothetical protein [Syntrophomonadaceae bacterium]